MLSALVLLSLLCSAHATDTTTTVATTTTVDGTTTTVDGTTTTDGATTTTGETTTSVGGTTTTGTGGSSTTVAAGATSQTTSGTCVDLIPETDVKNCAYLSYLCNDKNYIDLLTRVELSCHVRSLWTHRCPHPAPAVCKDKLNPSTGVSDCNRLSYLCNDSVYHTLMTEQCPKTCNRCGGAAPSPSACVDKVNPSTGVSDCPATAHLCNNSAYYKLMTEQCPKTCGRC